MNYREAQISVIIPIYNAEKTIRSCINQIITGNLFTKVVELILVNDGSTDNSLDICNEYASQYENIIVINQKNGGAGKARNRGLECASGQWIVFVDADDYISPHYFELILDSQTNADLLIFGTTSIKENQINSMFSSCKIPEIKKTYFQNDREKFIKSLLLNQVVDDDKFDYNIVTVWGKAFRSSFLKAIKLSFFEDQTIAEDMLFMLSIYENVSSIYVSNQIVYYYVKNIESVTNAYHGSILNDIKAFDSHIEEWLKRNNKYSPYYCFYRLNDIILYSKYVIFAKSTKNSKQKYNEFPLSKYKTYYKIVKENDLLKYYGVAKRVYFALFLEKKYLLCQIIFQMKR